MAVYRGIDSLSGTVAVSGKSSSMSYLRGLEEYRLLVQPGLDICAMIGEEKKYLKENFPDREKLCPPEILLGVFQANEVMEDTLIRWVQRVCMQVKSFIVSLNNYSSFPAHTIYLRVQDHEPFRTLKKHLKIIDEYLESSGVDGVNWLERPYITMSENLSSEQFEKAIIEYASKTFNASFLASELILVKKTNRKETCKLVNRFHLLPAIEKKI